MKKWLLYIAWVQALVATLTSLYFSEVLLWPPCILCWYQRIFIYPLVFIIGLGILLKDKNLPKYVLSLAIPGFLVALYHNLLYFGLVPDSAAPCISGVSCTTRFIAYFGFITIPFLSLAAFSVIIGCMYLYLRSSKR